MTDERLIRQVSGTSLLTFFALVFLFSIAFWAFAAVTDLQLMPGLSVSALAAFSPLLAGLILVYQERKADGVRELLKRSFDFKCVKAKRWYVPVLLLMFAVNLVVYGLMRGMDMPLPALEVHVWSALLMFIAFFAGALGEELGWSGYATDPLQDRWPAQPWRLSWFGARKHWRGVLYMCGDEQTRISLSAQAPHLRTHMCNRTGYKGKPTCKRLCITALAKRIWKIAPSRQSSCRPMPS